MEKDIRIITLGDVGVGKTSIINRICKENFHNNEISTSLVSFKALTKDYKKKKLKINLYFIDTGGQELFLSSLPRQYIRKSNIVLLVFSNKNNFESLKDRWFKFYKDNCDIEKSKFILVANKSDTFEGNRKAIEKLGEDFAEEINSFFITCSAKNQDNIYNLENFIITESKRLIDESEKNPSKDEDDYISLQGVKCKNNKKKRCC